MKVRGEFCCFLPIPRSPYSQTSPLCSFPAPCPLQVLPADKAVETMLKHMTDPSSASHLSLAPGKPSKPSCAPPNPLDPSLILPPILQDPLWCSW